jgi:hypothetical protein
MIDEKMPKEEETKNIDSLIDAKVDALLVAKELGLNVNSSDSVVDIKKAIIATKSDMALDGVCDAGIDTAYKMVKSQIAKDSLKQEEIKKSQSNAFDGLKHGKGKENFSDGRQSNEGIFIKGKFANADNKMIATVEAAIQTRETNVDDCRQNICEIKTQMDGKLENLNELF